VSFQWSGFANVPGLVIVMAVFFLAAFLGAGGVALRRSLQARRRWLESGLSIAEFTKAEEQVAAEQVRKAAEGWSLPAELDLPTPRRVRSAPLGARLLRSLPRLLLLMVLAIFIFTIGFLYTHPTHGARDESVPSFLFHVSQQMFADFSHARQWQPWMLWPSMIFLGFTGLSALPGHLRRRKQKKLLRRGKPARAVVTAVLHRPGSPKSSGGTRSKLEYQDDAGNAVTGYVDRKLFQDQVLTVLYDPDKPSRFTTYPVAGYEIGIPGDS
jgi:hypothetical protein